MTAEPVDPWAVIAAVFPKPVVVHAARPVTTLATGGTGYAHAALAAEAQRVTDAPEGTRNHALNRAGFSLGQLVAGGALAEGDALDALSSAAAAAGLDDDEITATLRSGLAGGAATPRGVPEPPDVDGWVRALPGAERPTRAAEAAEVAYDPQTGEVIEPPVRDDAAEVSRIIREKLPTLDWHALWADDSTEEWIVEPLLPARRLIALYSAPKVGKSLLMLELAVAISMGRPVL
ncbi:MAG: AAA family ATPase, partial [Pseudorhodobacter sp.]|nr:AAA family ATPase [Frankiaceae bacterium]